MKIIGAKFEVKSGKNRGYYIIVRDRKDAIRLIKRLGWGIMPEENHYDFYRRHRAQGLVIITHSIWARGIAKKYWEKIELSPLFCHCCDSRYDDEGIWTDEDHCYNCSEGCDEV